MPLALNIKLQRLRKEIENSPGGVNMNSPACSAGMRIMSVSGFGGIFVSKIVTKP